MGAKRFQDLVVWQKSHGLTLEIFRLVRRFPDDERFVLAQQMRRAAMSIPANIAEGFGCVTERNRARFYAMSRGSAEELRYFLVLAKDLRYLGDAGPLEALLDEICAMLHVLIRRILER